MENSIQQVDFGTTGHPWASHHSILCSNCYQMDGDSAPFSQLKYCVDEGGVSGHSFVDSSWSAASESQAFTHILEMFTSWTKASSGIDVSCVSYSHLCVWRGGGGEKKDQLFSEIHFPVTRVETLYSMVIIQITLPKNGLSTCAYVPCKER